MNATLDPSVRRPRLAPILRWLAGYVLVLLGVTFVMAVVTEIVTQREGLGHALLAGVFGTLAYGLVSIPFFGLYGLPALLGSAFALRRVGTTTARAAVAGAIVWAAWFGLLAAFAWMNGFSGPDFPTSVFWLPAWTTAGALFGAWLGRASPAAHHVTLTDAD